MRILVACALLTGLWGAGCTLQMDPNRNSGGDGMRHEAKGQELNKVFLDSVDYDSGDQSDWRYVQVPQRGILTVRCHFDNLEARTRINLLDAVGNVLATQFANGQPRQEATARVVEGRYYLEVSALDQGDRSSYTCEAHFDPVVWEE